MLHRKLPAELAEGVRLRVALDIVEALAEGDDAIVPRGPLSPRLQDVVVSAEGVASVAGHPGGEAGEGVLELLWEILVGRAADGEFPPVRDVVDEVPTDVAELVDRLLRDDDRGRIGELFEGLERAAEGHIASRDEVCESLGLAGAPEPAVPSPRQPPSSKPAVDTPPASTPKPVEASKPAEQPKPVEASKPAEQPKPAVAPKAAEKPKPAEKPAETPSQKSKPAEGPKLKAPEPKAKPELDPPRKPQPSTPELPAPPPVRPPLPSSPRPPLPSSPQSAEPREPLPSSPRAPLPSSPRAPLPSSPQPAPTSTPRPPQPSSPRSPLPSSPEPAQEPRAKPLHLQPSPRPPMATLQGVQPPDSVPPASAVPASVSPESAEMTPEASELLPTSVPPESVPELESVPPESAEPESAPIESSAEITPEPLREPTGKEPAKPAATDHAADPPMPKRRNAPISETFATDGPIDIPISTTPETPTFTAKGTQLVKPKALPSDVKIVIAGRPVRASDAPPSGVPAAPKFGPPPMSAPRPVKIDAAALEAARDLPPMRNQRRVGMIVGVVVTLFFVGVLLAIIGLSNE